MIIQKSHIYLHTDTHIYAHTFPIFTVSINTFKLLLVSPHLIIYLSLAADGCTSLLFGCLSHLVCCIHLPLNLSGSLMKTDSNCYSRPVSRLNSCHYQSYYIRPWQCLPVVCVHVLVPVLYVLKEAPGRPEVCTWLTPQDLLLAVEDCPSNKKSH